MIVRINYTIILDFLSYLFKFSLFSITFIMQIIRVASWQNHSSSLHSELKFAFFITLGSLKKLVSWQNRKYTEQCLVAFLLALCSESKCCQGRQIQIEQPSPSSKIAGLVPKFETIIQIMGSLEKYLPVTDVFRNIVLNA